MLNKFLVTWGIRLLWTVLVLIDLALTTAVAFFSVSFSLPSQLLSAWFARLCDTCRYIGLLSEGDSSNSPKIHCVIIGYSFGGFNVHHRLVSDETNFSNWTFTIIEPKSYFEFTPSIVECVANPQKFKTLSLPIDMVFNSKQSSLLRGYAVSLRKHSVRVQLCPSDTAEFDPASLPAGCVCKKLNASELELKFDYCLVASGSKYSAPIKDNVSGKQSDLTLPRRMASFQRIYDALDGSKGSKGCIKGSKSGEKSAVDVPLKGSESHGKDNLQHVAIIGGGPAGVELLAELLHMFPDKYFYILDKNFDLCHEFPKKSREYIANYLSKFNNVKCVLNASIQGIEDLEQSGKSWNGSDGVRGKCRINYTLDGSECSLVADCVFACMGFEPNTQFLFGAHASHGVFGTCCLRQGRCAFIKVNEYLETNVPQVLALGDVVYYPLLDEVKLVHVAELHAEYIHYYLTQKQASIKKIAKIEKYHEWLLGMEMDSKDAIKRVQLPLAYAISLGQFDGTLGFANLVVVNGVISSVFKWYIEWSKFTACQVNNYWNVAGMFRVYPLGYRVNQLCWFLGDETYLFFTRWWVRSKLKKLRKERKEGRIRNDQ